MQPSCISKFVLCFVIVISFQITAPVQAQNSYLSATGTFDTGGNFTFRFTAIEDYPVVTEFRTWAREGGTNAADDAIGSGGIDSFIEVRNSAGEVLGSNDDRGPGHFDSRLTPFGTNPTPHTYLPPLGPDQYSFEMSVLDGNTYGNGNWAADMKRTGAFAISLMENHGGSIQSLKFGADIPRGAVVSAAGGLNVDGGIEIGGGGLLSSASGAIRTKSLSLIDDARVELQSALVIDYDGPSTPIETLRTYLQSGYNNGSWDGNGIAPQDANLATQRVAIGYVENSQLMRESIGDYDLDSTSIVMDYTLAGDANLDHVVDAKDLGLLALHWRQSSATWVGGDFNYDSMVNINDLYLLARNWQLTLNAAPSQAIPSESFASALSTLGFSNLTAIPEPWGLSILCAMLLGWPRMRRKSAVAHA